MWLLIRSSVSHYKARIGYKGQLKLAPIQLQVEQDQDPVESLHQLPQDELDEEEHADAVSSQEDCILHQVELFKIGEEASITTQSIHALDDVKAVKDEAETKVPEAEMGVYLSLQVQHRTD